MKRVSLLLFVQIFAISVFSDEYKDLVTNVIYTYNPSDNKAEVKRGEDWEYLDNGETLPGRPGSPDAKGEIVILDNFTINGKEYIVDRIGECAFLYLNITSVIIPSSVKSIGYHAFADCKSLSNVSLSEGLDSIRTLAFQNCISLKGIFLPEGLRVIQWGAFSGSNLTSIIIPSSVKVIGTGAFSSQSINTITSLIENPFVVQDICSPPLQNQITLRVPCGTKVKYEATAGWNQFGTIEELLPTGINSSLLDKDPLCIDLQGRRITGKPAKGLYIQNGKKYVK